MQTDVKNREFFDFSRFQKLNSKWENNYISLKNSAIQYVVFICNKLFAKKIRGNEIRLTKYVKLFGFASIQKMGVTAIFWKIT